MQIRRLNQSKEQTLKTINDKKEQMAMTKAHRSEEQRRDTLDKIQHFEEGERLVILSRIDEIKVVKQKDRSLEVQREFKRLLK